MSKIDFHDDDYYEPYVQEMNSDLLNSIPTTGRYWAFIVFTAFVLISYQFVGSIAILYEHGVFAIPEMYYTRSSRGADKYNTFSIFMFCCWQYVVIHEIAYSNPKVGKLIFIIFTLISAFIGMEFIFATPDYIIPLELDTEKGVNFFKNFFRLVILSYQIICLVVIIPFLVTNNRLIISPYETDSQFQKNMRLFPAWFPFVALIVVAIVITIITGFTGGNSNTGSHLSSSAEVVPTITTAEVRAEIESILSRYTGVTYIRSRVTIEDDIVVHVSVTIDGAGNYVKSIVSELREIAPLSNIWIFDKNSHFLYQD